MTCDRCRQTLTVRDWLHEWCPKPKIINARDTVIRHSVTGIDFFLGERALREALVQQEQQAEYARSQV